MLNLSKHYAPVPKPVKSQKASPKVSTKRVTPVRRSPVKKVNRERSKKEWYRAYGSPDRVAFIASLPCVISGERGISQNVHVKGDGAARKAAARFIVPMQLRYHEELHRIGIKSFEAKYSIDLARWADITDKLYKEHQRSGL